MYLNHKLKITFFGICLNLHLFYVLRFYVSMEKHGKVVFRSWLDKTIFPRVRKLFSFLDGWDSSERCFTQFLWFFASFSSGISLHAKRLFGVLIWTHHIWKCSGIDFQDVALRYKFLWYVYCRNYGASFRLSLLVITFLFVSFHLFCLWRLN